MPNIVEISGLPLLLCEDNVGEQFDFAESERNAGAAGRLAEALRRLSLVLPRSCHGNCHASPPYVRGI